jgi:hypothetical protein
MPFQVSAPLVERHHAVAKDDTGEAQSFMENGLGYLLDKSWHGIPHCW